MNKNNNSNNDNEQVWISFISIMHFWKHYQNIIFYANPQLWSLSVDEDDWLYMKIRNHDQSK